MVESIESNIIENALGLLMTIIGKCHSKTLHYYIFSVEIYINLILKKIIRNESTRIELQYFCAVQHHLKPFEVVYSGTS